MGFLDKLKSAKNMVTGGGAKVQLEIGQATLGGEVSVVVRAQVAGAPMNASRVYVIARAQERIKMTVRDQDDPGDRDRINENYESFRQEFQVTGPVEMEADSQHEWQGQFQLPANSQPSYQGRNAVHVWEFQAGLDVKGNDPDSGWVEAQVR
jgi:hypothetical protein